MRFYLLTIFFNVLVCVSAQETVDLETLKSKTFRHLNRNRIYGGILINSSVLPIDLDVYSKDAQAETNYDTWIKIYWKIYSAHLDKPEIPHAREIFDKAEEYNKKGIVPLGICHFNYSSIRADAVDKGLLRVIDDAVYEVSAFRDTPYELKECIAFAPLSRGDHGSGRITFLLNDDFIFDNTGSKVSAVSIDFADGSGFREVRLNESVPVVYVSSGEKTIRMNISMGEKKYSLRSTIQIGNAPMPSTKSSNGGNDLGDEVQPHDDAESIQVNYNGWTVNGTWGVYYGCDNVLDKPVIVIEGFDPLNGKSLNGENLLGMKVKKKNLYAINDTEQHILNKLREIGYDIVILDFEYNPIDLNANGRLAAALIETINSRKTGNNELIVMGRSGGGLLARYALAYLEDRNINHQTRLLLTIDAPHQGANIPLGLQHFINFVSKDPTIVGVLGLASLAMKTDILDASINSVYAEQILYYHHLAAPNNAYPSPLKNGFMSNLNSLNGGYPEKVMKAAISSGSEYGENQGFAFNGNLLDWNWYDLPDECATLRIANSVKALPDQNTSGTVMSSQIQARFPISLFLGIPCVLFTSWKTLASSKTITVSNALPYDNAPGGNAGWHNFNFDPFMTDVGFDLVSFFTMGVSTEADNSCFVPVISAIDLNSNILPTSRGGLFYNVNSSLASNPHMVKVNNVFYNLSPPNVSPFDIIYVAPANQRHAESNSEWHGLFDSALTPGNLYLQNQNIANDRVYHARNQITAGRNVTATIPQGDFTVKAGTHVKMTSGNTIRFLPGFKTEPGAEFTASIHEESTCAVVNKSASSTTLNRSDDDGYESDFANKNDDAVFDMIVSTEKAVTVYPNPADSRIMVAFNRYSETGIIIEIYDAAGEIRSVDKDASRISEFDLGNYPAGMYLIKVITNGQIFTEKFIKQ